MTGALVLAGGGLAGIAWEIGVLAGISDAAPDVFEAIMRPEVAFVGTSAGSAVAAQLASGAPLEELYSGQLAEETAELGADIDLAAFQQTMTRLMDGVTSPEEFRRRLGKFAREADTPTAAERRAVIAARLPLAEWPERRLLITAVDTNTGELRVFDRDSGVSLLDAVSASCAVPGVWPTVEIDGIHYMDGGMRTSSNLDLAAGCDPVLVLTPSPEKGPMGDAISPAELAALGTATVSSVFVDAASLAAFGSNPLDPAVRPGSVVAGREQGRQIAAGLQPIWR
jgi:NTE family protein